MKLYQRIANIKEQWTSAIIIAVLLCSVGLGFVFSGVTSHWSNQIYDGFQKVGLPTAEQSKVAIVAIDSASLQQIGRWPWPRSIHATLLDKLTKAGAAVIAFDIHFAEPAAGDKKLAKAIQRHGKVVLPVFFEKNNSGSFSVSKPRDVLIKAGAVLGHVHLDISEEDGVARRINLIMNAGSEKWPALGLAMLEQGSTSNKKLRIIDNRLVEKNDSNPPLARNNKIMLPFSQKNNRIQQLSYRRILNTPDNALAKLGLKDKYILVGLTAVGLSPYILTPAPGTKKTMPGVEFQALVLDVLMNNQEVMPFSLKSQFILTAIFLLIPLILYYLLSNEWIIIGIGGLLLLTLMFSFIALKLFHFWFPPVPVLITLALSYPLWGWRHLKRAGQRLSQQEKQILLTTQSIADGVITTDENGRVTYLNLVAEHMTGFTLAEASGKLLDQVLKLHKQPEQALMNWLKISQKEDTASFKSLDQSGLISRSGRKYNVSISAGLLREKNDVQGMVLAICDLTEVKREAKKVAYLVSHEKLTRLPNRSLLKEHVRTTIQHQKELSGTPPLFAVYFLNIDNFTRINDALGRNVGDKILRIIAKRLKALRKEGGLVAHLGGDEFATFCTHLKNKEEAAELASAMIDKIDRRIIFNDQQLHLSVSIGISFYPENGKDDEVLISKADVAMRHAKRLGRNNFQFFTAEMDHTLSDALHLEQSLREALKNNELEVYYQPQVDLETGTINGLEALVRWPQQDGKMIPPSTFIPVAEESGLIQNLGQWVLDESCRQGKAWQDAGIPPIRMSVNLSPQQFLNSDIVLMIKSILLKTGFDARYLEIEITEGAVMQNYPKALETLSQFKKLGGQVSLDDFGTGYSSFSRLKNMPIDQLKIDQSFVFDIAESRADAAVTHAMITMAHDMGIVVVAEGVESLQQLEILKRQNCDEFQGYFFSRPLPASGITTLLQKAAGTDRVGAPA